eukprot:355034-Chlamydomonas_euryale.AAC.2
MRCACGAACSVAAWGPESCKCDLSVGKGARALPGRLSKFWVSKTQSTPAHGGRVQKKWVESGSKGAGLLHGATCGSKGGAGLTHVECVGARGRPPAWCNVWEQRRGRPHTWENVHASEDIVG